MSDVRDKLEEALVKTPLEPYVLLTGRPEDPTRPLVSWNIELERWEASIYLVDARTQLPVWLPKGSGRSRPQKFVHVFVPSVDPVTNRMRTFESAKALRTYAKQKLKSREAGLRSAAKRAASADPNWNGGKHRPKGIPRAQERPGPNPSRNCPECGVHPTRHKAGVCPNKGESA